MTIDTCDVTRDGHRCALRSGHDGPHEADSREYVPVPSASRGGVHERLAELEAARDADRRRLDVLDAQVRSLQCALPSGIGHAGLAKTKQ